jgi:ABC-2 type transport system permease protein
VNGTRGGLGSVFLSMTVADFAREVREEWLPSPGKPLTPAFAIVPQYRYNPHLRYPIFMVPALMVMLMTMICGFLPALNIVSEKESGTIEQINVSPVKRSTFILSKLLPYWVIGFVVFSICMFVARLFYGLIPQGNLVTIYLFASVFVLAFSGLGLVISNVAKSIQQAMFLMFFFVMTCIFLSGLYTPVASMPQWAQTISMFSPLKYFIQVMRLVYLKGSGFADLTSNFLALCGFAVFFNTLAVITYKKSS